MIMMHRPPGPDDAGSSSVRAATAFVPKAAQPKVRQFAIGNVTVMFDLIFPDRPPIQSSLDLQKYRDRGGARSGIGSITQAVQEQVRKDFEKGILTYETVEAWEAAGLK